MENKKVVTIYMEANPNPNSLKFVFNFMLMPEGESLDYPDSAAAADSPLAQELFKLPYVGRVFFMSNFITITKNTEQDWLEIREEIKEFLKGYFEKGGIIAHPKALEKPAVSENETEVVGKIKNILDEYIRPAVEQDGGAIQFHSFDEGKVKVLLQGSCSGCPSSTITLKAGIENLLKRMVPEVQEVVAEGV
ncbi:NifU family protein [Cytophagales bacterium LB-30]|uniref:NifU family protein n=1 Tax=Shiella aurantiaca TaxID=3058365 RepID=A0ABT8F6P3_9BACT|nr:NifU family protein [Shiella aurantiaca]MDN4166040.1 NifU family protein [Shiella aurantiaca]